MRVCTDRKKTKPFFCLNQNRDLWRMSQELYIYLHYRPFADAQKTRILVAFCILFFISSIPRTILSFPPSNKLHNPNQYLGVVLCRSTTITLCPSLVIGSSHFFCLSHSYHDATAWFQNKDCMKQKSPIGDKGPINYLQCHPDLGKGWYR